MTLNKNIKVFITYINFFNINFMLIYLIKKA